MSTEPPSGYEPSDPPTLADWRHLEERADANRRRSRRGVLLGIVSVVLLIVIGIAGALVYADQRDVPKVLANTNEIVRGLQEAERDRDASDDQNALALAVIVEGIAGGFATSPYPDPARVAAVQQLCDTAKAFRQAAGEPQPPCPSP